MAPILGPGAAPFAEGYDQGTPADLDPVDLASWLEPFLPPGKAKPDKMVKVPASAPTMSQTMT